MLMLNEATLQVVWLHGWGVKIEYRRGGAVRRWSPGWSRWWPVWRGR